tara:strand:- start:3171 stop:3980 length:810 start_codon:yes stop_codon:yes gene_type:complete
MEIGQQFLMLQIENKITSDDLSILIFKDRAAFCTLNQSLYFDLEKKNISSESLGTWLKYHHIKKKNNKCVLFDHTGVIVPHKLFDETNKNLYLSLSEDELKNKVIETKFIKSDNQIFIFSQTRDWRLLLNDLVVNLEITHFAAELIPFLSKISNENLKKNVFIHLRKDYFDLFIYQGSQLMLYNSFPHKDEEEFLYYLFFVLEQFYLKQNQFTAIFLGKFQNYQKYYEAFKEFHTLTKFTYPDNLEIDAHHPAPFFNYFYNYENNFREI